MNNRPKFILCMEINKQDRMKFFNRTLRFSRKNKFKNVYVYSKKYMCIYIFWEQSLELKNFISRFWCIFFFLQKISSCLFRTDSSKCDILENDVFNEEMLFFLFNIFLYVELPSNQLYHGNWGALYGVFQISIVRTLSIYLGGYFKQKNVLYTMNWFIFVFEI